MNADVMEALRDLLNDDVTLQGLLGGTDRVVIGWINQDTVVPCVTIWEGDESSTLRAGYAASGHRDCFPVVHLDSWINTRAASGPTTSKELNVIADRVETLIFGTGVKSATGISPAWETRCWRRISSTEPGPEKASGYSHKSRVYGFEYSIQD